MGVILAFFIGVFFGIILMGLCVSSSMNDRKNEKKDIHDEGDELSC